MYIGKSIDDLPFKAIIAALNGPAVFLDKTGIIQYANGLYTKTMGRTPAVSEGTAFSDVLDASSQASFRTFKKACLDDPTVDAPLFECALSGLNSDLHMTIAPVIAAGELHGFLCQLAPHTTREHLKLRYLLDHLDQGVWEYDTKSKLFAVSAAWRRMRGMAPDHEINVPNRDWLDDIHPEDRHALQQVFEGQARGESSSFNIQYRWHHPSGHWVWIMCSAKVMDIDEQGRPSLIVGTDTDISKLRQNEGSMHQLAEQLRLAVDASAIGIWEFDPNSGTVHWDDRMLDMYGLTDGSNDRSADSWETHLHPDDLAATLAYSDHCQANGLDFRRDYRIVRPDGAIRHIRSRATQVKGYGALPKLVGANIDITEDMQRTEELEQAKAQLRHDSRHDALTGLANRRLLDETVAASASIEGPYAVLHLDLDYFKTVNDTFGHAAGDAVLVEVASRLKSIIGTEGLVCRVGGDEFGVFYETAPSKARLHRICEQIVTAMQRPIQYQRHPCQIGISIGCAIEQGLLASQSDIFKRADSALYSAKSAGRNCYRFDPVLMS